MGMTQVFSTDGLLIPVTVVEVNPNVVMQKKTLENDGYEAVQLGYEEIKESRANKAQKGHAQKAGTTARKFVREIRGNELFSYEPGQEIKADLFAAGDLVDVTGISKGKGFSGAVKRNNQHLGPASHGSGHHRGPGSLATIGRNNGIINKGRLLAGHEGVYTTTNQNLEVIKVDTTDNYILIKGNVPGPKRGLVVIKTTVKKNKTTKPAVLIDRAPAVVEVKEEADNGDETVSV